MALFRCGEGSNQPTETTLWTNSDTSTNFNAQDVTLSSDVTDFDFIKFEFKCITTGSDSYNALFPSDEVATWPSTWTNDAPAGSLCGRGNGTYVRPIFRVSNTSIHFNDATAVGVSGGNNGNIVPVAIIGVKL